VIDERFWRGRYGLKACPPENHISSKGHIPMGGVSRSPATKSTYIRQSQKEQTEIRDKERGRQWKRSRTTSNVEYQQALKKAGGVTAQSKKKSGGGK